MKPTGQTDTFFVDLIWFIKQILEQNIYSKTSKIRTLCFHNTRYFEINLGAIHDAF